MKNKIFIFCLLLLGARYGYAQGPGCPNVNAGPDKVLPCNVTCTTLTATLFQTGQTTNYNVSAIPYTPPSPSGAWVSSFVNTDDIWSGVIALPFNFCYYGTAYNRLVIGANGIISFNTGYANQFCPWNYTASIPSPNLPLNAIFGAYHDIDPSVCGQIRYAISGTSPCRTFMFDFNQVCHFSCTNLKTTQRIVLYETSNAIEVYIGNKPTCNGWNGGRAVIGIQNAGGDIGMVAPGRQTGNWSANNEAWRFTPSGAPNYSLTWYSSTSPTPLGTGTSVNVCPTATFSTYSAVLTYTNCDNSTVTVSDEVAVTLTGPSQPAIFVNSPVCSGATINFATPNLAGATFVWAGPGGWTSNLQNPARTGATTAMAGNYTLYVVVAGCTSSVATTQVSVISAATLPNFTTNSPVCAGTNIAFDGPTLPGATYVWSGPGGWNPGNVEDPVRASATAAMSGVYSLYVVVNGCTSGTATQNVVVNPAPAAPVFTTNSPVCTNTTLNLNGPTVAGATYIWSGPGGWTSSVQNPTRPNTTLGMAGTYSLYVVVSGCTSAVSTRNVVINGPDIPSFSVNSAVCQGDPIQFDATTIAGATYVWTGPNGFSSSLEDPVIPVSTPAASGTYSLYLVTNGCTSITATNDVVVNSVAAPVFQDNGPICAGQSLVLDGPTVASAIYFWTGPGWTSSSEDTTIVNATTAASGTYSLYIVINGCTSATTTHNITVNAIPATPAITSNTPVCSGQTLNLDGPTVAGATYVWTGPNGFTSALEDPVLTPATTAMTGTYNLYVVVNGCTSVTASTPVTVNATPATPVVGSNSPVCTGNALNLTATTVTGTYYWTGPNAFTSAAQNPTMNPATTAMTGTYSLYVVSSGCTSSTVTTPVTVNTTPATPTVGANTPVCAGQSLNLTANAFTGTYYWTGPNAYTSATQNPVLNPATTAMAGTYSLYLVENGCTSGTATQAVIVNPAPVLAVTHSDVNCQGDVNGSGSATVTGGTAPLNYAWNTTPPQLTPNATNLAPGTYTVGVLDALGCSDQKTVTVITRSVAPNIQAAVNNESCAGTSDGAINVTMGGGSPPYTYLWNTGATTEDLTGLGDGSYSLTATDRFSCNYTANFNVLPGGSVAAQVNVNNILCYGDLTGSIAVTPAGGAPPYTISLNGVPVTGQQLSHLPAGNYLIRVADNNGCDTVMAASITAPPPITGDSTYHQIRLGDHLTLSPSYGGGTGQLSMYWTPAYNLNCIDCPNPMAWPTKTTKYFVHILDQNGCEGTGIVVVDVFHDGPFIPNAFTPGKDDLNMEWKVSDYGIDKFELYVFDRWGEKLFYTDNIYQGWDGKAPNGNLYQVDVYVYKTNITYIDGTQKTLLGHVTLLR